MKTLQSTKINKVKTLEVKLSNMTFIVKCEMHFIPTEKNPSWSTPKFTATIKETGVRLSTLCGKKFMKKQMELINSKPHLFL